AVTLGLEPAMAWRVQAWPARSCSGAWWRLSPSSRRRKTWLANLRPLRMASAPAKSVDASAGDWPAYGRTAERQQYSPLGQITPENVAELEVAWEYHAGQV